MAADDTPVSPSTTPPISQRSRPSLPDVFRWSDSSGGFSLEMQCQLKRRLRMVTWILVAGSGAFLLRNLLVWNFSDATPPSGATMFLWVHVAALALTSIPLFPLNRKCEFAVGKLRLMEFLVFGVTGLFFVWMQLHASWHCDPDEIARFAAAYPADTSIRWIILVQLYALYVPVATRCTTTQIVLLSIVPLVTAMFSAGQLPELHDVLYRERMFSVMVLWMAMNGAIAIHRTMHFGQLQKEVFDAQRLGAYTLKERIGAGGMGEVYRAEHALLKRPAAIKLIRPDKAGQADALARFEEEVQAAACLTHPNSIQIFDYGRADDGTFYYVMEFLPGMSLQEIIERFGPLPPERAVHILRQIAGALREAHMHGLVHRDVKPSNVFVTERGGDRDVAKLLDFGLVKSAEASDVKLTMDGAIVGSPLYAAPETVSGGLDARSDLYSLGATAFHALAGRPVFEGDQPLRVLFAHVNETPPILSDVNPDVPEELSRVVARCLEKEPDDRYGSIDAFLVALDECRLPDRWTLDRAESWWSEHTVATGEATFEPNEETVLVTT